MGTQDAALLDATSMADESIRAETRVITLPWYQLSLGAILLLSAVLNFWQLDRLGYGNSYYAAAVRSMMQSWHNFFFAAFDPNGFVSIDKPPVGFWFQVASARVFGYNGVSLLLPSALAGVLSVWLLYYLVARVFGRGAGLLAALAMAVTPVAVASDRSNIIDSILVLFLLLAAWALSLAAETGKLRWLLACVVLVGIGFNIKMLEAYLVVPAFGVVYLLGAPRTWLVRIGHLALATLVLLAVSFSWAVAVDLTPASQRPWVDSTTTNSELDLAIGYNGLQRLTGQLHFGGRGAPPRGNVAGATTGTGATQGQQQGAGAQSAQNAPAIGGTGFPQGGTNAGGPFGSGSGRSFNFDRGRQGGGGGGMFNNGAAGPLRLLNESLGGQAGWLLPLAVIGLLAAATRRLVRLPLAREEKGLLLWGAWLLTAGGFFSVAGFFHSYYLVTLAPAVAALAGIGLVALWHDYRRGSWRGWLLPVALLVTAGVQVSILRPYTDWSTWLTPLVLGLTLAGAAVLVLAKLRRRSGLRLWTPVAAAIGMLALLLAPTAWAADTMANGGGGMTPSAGPTAGRDGNPFGSAGGFGGPGGNASSEMRGTGGLGRNPFGELRGSSTTRRSISGFVGGDGAGVASGLLTYLEQHQGSTRYLLAVQNSNAAAPYIIQTGKAVMSLGGFGGNDPILTLSQLQALVKNNTVRYFSGIGGFGSSSGIGQWVQNACTVVPASAYGGSTSSGSMPSGFPSGGMPGNGAAGPGGTQGPPPGFAPGGAGFGGFRGFGGGQQLYDCAGAVR